MLSEQGPEHRRRDHTRDQPTPVPPLRVSHKLTITGKLYHSILWLSNTFFYILIFTVVPLFSTANFFILGAERAMIPCLLFLEASLRTHLDNPIGNIADQELYRSDR